MKQFFSNIKGMRSQLCIMHYALCISAAALLMTACSPESFDGADPNGLPSVSGVDFNLSVDQESNQMIATYTPQAGTYPVWILNGSTYSTLQEVGFQNPEAGTYTIDLKIGNRNGFSQGTISKTFTFNETKIDYTSDFRKITGKEWRFANKEVAHLACGPAGTDGTEWWKAAADEKKDFGMYDDRITFTADNRKGGTFNYNAGEDGLTYVNTGTTKWGHEDADFDAVIGNQTSSWSFEVYDWTDAAGQVTKQTYIQLAPNTAFPYISSDAQYEDPRFRIEQLTAKKLVLIYETPDRSIAWRFIFTSEEAEKEWAGYDANSDFNMWKGITPVMTFYYNPDPSWGNEQTDVFASLFQDAGNDYMITVPNECFAEWQAQVHFHTDLVTSAAVNYDFSCVFTSDADIDGVVVKLTNEDDSEAIIDEHNINLKAGEDYIFWVSNVPGLDMSPVKLVMDFGHAKGETNINVTNIVLKDHANDDGTVPPNNDNPDNPDQPTVKWVEVDSPDNQGADFNKIGEMQFWWANGSWTQIGDPYFSYANGVYTIVATENGGSEWMAQNSIHNAVVNVEAGQLYDIRAKIEASDDLGRYTFKICDEGDDDNTLIYKGDLKLEAGEQYVEFIGVKAQKGGEDSGFTTAKLFIDLGGAPEGFEFKLSEIIIQKHQEGESGESDALSYDDPGNLLKAVDDGTVKSGFGYWFANDSWTQIPNNEATHSGDTYVIVLPEGMGGSQWQGQFHIDTQLTASAALAYDFQLVIEADDDCPGVTIKLTDSGDTNFFCEGRHDITADEPFVYTLKGATLKEGKDASAIRLFFDFGGSPAGTKVKISQIVFKEAQ